MFIWVLLVRACRRRPFWGGRWGPHRLLRVHRTDGLRMLVIIWWFGGGTWVLVSCIAVRFLLGKLWCWVTGSDSNRSCVTSIDLYCRIKCERIKKLIKEINPANRPESRRAAFGKWSTEPLLWRKSPCSGPTSPYKSNTGSPPISHTLYSTDRCFGYMTRTPGCFENRQIPRGASRWRTGRSWEKDRRLRSCRWRWWLRWVRRSWFGCCSRRWWWRWCTSWGLLRCRYRGFYTDFDRLQRSTPLRPRAGCRSWQWSACTTHWACSYCRCQRRGPAEPPPDLLSRNGCLRSWQRPTRRTRWTKKQWELC